MWYKKHSYQLLAALSEELQTSHPSIERIKLELKGEVVSDQIFRHQETV